jgi:hypothetical protein
MTSFLATEITALLVGCGLTATLLVVRASLPSLAGRCDAAAASRTALRRFLIGILNGPTLLLLAVALGKSEGSKWLAVLVTAVLAALALWGFVAVVPRLGRRIAALSSRDASDPAATLFGGAALTAAFLLPVAGWIVAAAATLLAVGTGVSALFTRRP